MDNRDFILHPWWEEVEYTSDALRKSGYSAKYIKVCKSGRREKVLQTPSRYAYLPYIYGISNKLRRVLEKKNIK